MGSTLSELTPEILPLDSLPCFEFVDLVSREDYSGALSLADSVIKNNPLDPGGYFLRLTSLNNSSIDFEDDLDIPELLVTADTLTAMTERLLAKNNRSPLLLFYRGSVEGFLMVRALRVRDYWAAIIHGERASKWLEQSISLDSTVYDAYVGLGNYYYFKSRYGGVLRSTGVISDRREEGKRLLEIASKRGVLTRMASVSSLAWIAIDEENYPLAIRLAGQLKAKYPENRAFHWCIGRAQMKSKQWSEAITTYTEILASVRNSPRNNHYNEIGCLHSLAQASFHLNDWEQVVKYANEALNLKIDSHNTSRKEDDLKRLKKLRSEGLKRIAAKNNR